MAELEYRRIRMKFHHIPVLFNETIEMLNLKLDR